MDLSTSCVDEYEIVHSTSPGHVITTEHILTSKWAMTLLSWHRRGGSRNSVPCFERICLFDIPHVVSGGRRRDPPPPPRVLRRIGSDGVRRYRASPVFIRCTLPVAGGEEDCVNLTIEEFLIGFALIMGATTPWLLLPWASKRWVRKRDKAIYSYRQVEDRIRVESTAM
eukprot:Em0502g1a